MDTGHLDELLEQVCSNDVIVRLKAFQQLIEQGDRITTTLLQRLSENGSMRQKTNIIAVLEELRDARAIPALIDALTHSNLTMRLAAAKALGSFPGTQAYTALIERLYQETGLVETWILISLGKLRDPRTVEPLLDLLYRTSNAPTRYMVIRVLGELGDPAVIPHIRSFIDDLDAHVRQSACTALEQLTQGAEVC